MRMGTRCASMGTRCAEWCADTEPFTYSAQEWFQCIDMKDVEVPSPAFFGLSAATGDQSD